MEWKCLFKAAPDPTVFTRFLYLEKGGVFWTQKGHWYSSFPSSYAIQRIYVWSVLFRAWWQERQMSHSGVCISRANIRFSPFFNAGSWKGMVLKGSHRSICLSLFCLACSDGSLLSNYGSLSPPSACTGPSTLEPHYYCGTWAQKQPSTEPGILLRRSSNDSIRSKGGFWASSDLEYDQLNMKKCLIKLTWKSLEGSWKLKATTQHMAQQPLSTCYKHRTVTSEGCAALSFCQLSPWQQRDQPGSHHPHCRLMSRSMSLKGPNFTRGRQIGKN